MSDKPKWIQKLAEFLIDNITILLTIGFAGYVICSREIASVQFTTEQLLTAILGVLGLLATSEIVERYRRLSSIEKSSKYIQKLLESRFTERPSALAFFQKPPNYDTYIQNADRIDLCGTTLTSTIHRQFSNLRESVKKGADIRLLLTDPDSLALQMASLRSGSPSSIEYFKNIHEASFRDIEYLHNELMEYSHQSANSPGNMVLGARFFDSESGYSG